MRSKLQMMLIAVPCVWLSLAASHAQITSGSVSGTVLDAQGAVVGGAKGKLRNKMDSVPELACGGRGDIGWSQTI
jgi:hypothetical protein